MLATNSDLIGLVASYAYATVLLILAEALRRWFKIPSELTRKLIHIGAGMWVFGVLALFQRWESGIIPFATFIPINYLLYRYRILGAMDTADSSPGTVYFALSVTLLFGLLWRPDGPVDYVPMAVAGVMAMTWGDALAALVGRRIGKHQYRIGGSQRSWEGSVAMFVASVVVMFGTLWLLPGSSFSPLATPSGVGQALLTALVGALFVTLAEAVSPHGTDNLSVPLVGAGVLLAIAQGFS
ncbi:diacylglycerol/polyprenol kinase family protein [Microseira wollei]|uniref:Phosphatidate cytidylyltransferase n=1 Tax=Microseira wollei NIES-4236 TaxID=2530354 RepID=A0AAV3XMV8_9CYAN|nr:diacylglycerol/polyprenol kinase family protein [Microseira wollei]GET44252.1 phosphatidate cytidylyltransferase [Microseira wollei NIES-4236]